MHITEKEEEESFYLLPLFTRGGRGGEGGGGLLRPPKNQQQPFKGRGGASALFSQKKKFGCFPPIFSEKCLGCISGYLFSVRPPFLKKPSQQPELNDERRKLPLPSFPPLSFIFPRRVFFRSAAAGDRDGKRGEAKFNFVGGRKADKKDTTAELF